MFYVYIEGELHLTDYCWPLEGQYVAYEPTSSIAKIGKVLGFGGNKMTVQEIRNHSHTSLREASIARIFNQDVSCRFVPVDTYTLWMEYPMGGKVRTQRVCTLVDRELLRRMKRDLEEHLRDEDYLAYRITQNERTPRTTRD